MIKKFLLILSGLTLLFLPIKILAQEEQILSFDSMITLNTDSTINVKETINYHFSQPRHGINRQIPYRYHNDNANKNFQTPIEDLTVTDEESQPYQFSIAEEENYLNIKIGDPDQTISGNKTYIIAYKVIGVINYFDDHDELYWNVTGNQWEVPIGKVSAIVGLPEGINYDALKLACFTGKTGSQEQNCQKSFETGKADFTSANGPLTIVVGWNKGIVTPLARQYEQPSQFDQIWSKIHHESGWYLLLPFIVLIILLIRYFRFGRDPQGRGTIAPEFVPPDKLLPGEMGTLVDEKVDRQDISATIIDLAVRGFLKIKERADKKYTLIKIKEASADFKDYEKTIFEGLFASHKEIDLEDLHTDFSDKLSKIQAEMYGQLVERKYFLKDPNKIRKGSRWLGFAIAFFLPFILFWFSIILAVAGFISGILLMIFSRSTPKKTREGVIAKEKSLGFKEFLYRAERYRVKWQEKENIFEKYLPYAMVFGIIEKWAENFRSLYKNPPDWYEGGSWTTFNTVVFASSLNFFSTSASSSFSPPSTAASSGSSGFGGGGSSGGGFGGGGGGSW